ncbi:MULTISPECIES: hypothetical protein [Asticcacaulis]|uniref:hypothetical protein n=1 Tax=Asticcacaulis TaxID=76890 RepID=UPI001AE0FA71|nr:MULTISPECIES: hypothetical protein [Asticcacaulis]MBP2161873.1 hypothetical protein [Asticcacaulis solisilvae]MDR6802919.1 hypothetical protein [Asticcacaulis sp. BE141]
MRFFIVDPSLYDAGGHNLDYAVEVSASVTAQGHVPIITGNRRFTSKTTHIDVQRVFKTGLREPASLVTRLAASLHFRAPAFARRWPFFPDHYEPLHDRAADVIRDWARFVSQVSARRDDQWFFPTVTWCEAGHIARFARTSGQIGRVHVILRFDPPEAPTSCQWLKESFAGLNDLELWADTPELAEAYQQIGVGKVRCARMPFPTLTARPSPKPYVAFLGEARLDKGFQYLPAIIRQALTQTSADFHIQILPDPNRNPQVAAAIHEVRALAGERVTLMDGALATADYNTAMSQAAAILCLHDPGTYRFRSAGVVTQALSAGIPVIMQPGSSAPHTMISRNACTDIVALTGLNEAENVRAIRQCMAVKKRARRHLDVLDDWSAPWLQLPALAP